MKRLFHIKTILIILLLFHQLISGCTTTVSERSYENTVYQEEVDVSSQNLFRDKCSLCHELPDIEGYHYSPDDWADIVDYMLKIDEMEQKVSRKEVERIKNYLIWLSNPSNQPIP